jgi:Zn-dependent protease with chaperone function
MANPFFGRKCVALFLVASLTLFVGCRTVPITGRSQVNLVADNQLVASANTQFSSFIDEARKNQALLSASESPQAAETIATVNRVSNRIIDAAGLRRQFRWETVVVKSTTVNASAMPNGKIVVYTGLLSMTKSEAELAAVLGHEVGHVMAHHSAERVSQVLLTQTALSAANAALASRDSKYTPAISAALGLGARYGVILPFSRSHESEADYIGLILMSKAGYDPSEAMKFWQRMEGSGSSGSSEFLSTHPSDATRIEQIRTWLPEANLYFADQKRPLPNNLDEMQTAVAERSSLAARAPIAPLPVHEVGFWYRNKVSNQTNPVIFRYARNEACDSGECMILENDRGESAVYTRDRAIVEIKKADSSWTRFSPPMRVVQWPIHVGDTWTQTTNLEQSSGRRSSGKMKADVVSYEAVKVPAGEFLAYKIVVSLDGVRFSESWYAPETQTTVRSVTYGRGGTSTSELLDYERPVAFSGPIKSQ